jgi:Flp pilus assembly protein TadD
MPPMSRNAEAQAGVRTEYRDSADRQQVREWGLRAGRQLEEGQIRDAELTLRLALAKAPADPRCRSLLAICLTTERGKLATAEKLARSVLSRDPDDAVAHYALGRVLLETGERRQAFREFSRARALSGSDPSLRASVRRQDPRRSPVISSLPRDHFLNVVLGRLFRRLGQGRGSS